MSSSTPFYQQLNSRFSALFFLFILALTLLGALLYWQTQQLSSVLEQDLPQVATVYRHQQNIYQAQKLLIELRNSQTAGQLQQGYLALISELEAILKLPSTKQRQLAAANSALKAQRITVNRLAANENRNALLRESTEIQLQLVLDGLKTSENALKDKQDKLYQQLAQDKVSDRVTTARLKAYLALAQQKDLTMQTRIAVQRVSELFEQITLAYPLVEFDHVSQQLSDVLTLWQQQFEQIEQVPEVEKQRITNLIALRNLLFTEQSIMAKWRGHIRVAQEFLLLLEPISIALQQQLNPMSVTAPQSENLASVFNRYLPANILVSQRQVEYLLIALFIAIIFFFVLLLRHLRFGIKRYDEANLSLLEKQLAGSDELFTRTLFQQQLTQLLAQVTKPKYSEQDFLQLQHKFTERATQLLEQGGVILASSDYELCRQLQPLLFSDTEKKKSWRYAFTTTEIKQLLAVAKQAKTTGEKVSVAVMTLAQQPLLVSVSYHEHHYSILVAKNDAQHQQAQKLEQLQQTITQQQQQQHKQLVSYAEQLSQMLIRAMLQNQSTSIGSGEPSLQITRQLQRTLDWCHQLGIEQQIKTQQQFQINDAWVPEEILSAIHNIAQQANWQRNKVIFIQDPLLLHGGQLKLSLFHRLIASIAKLCLQDKFNVRLVIEARLVDKNAGQQKVELAFKLYAEQENCNLPDSLKILASLTSEQQDNSLPVKYLQALIKANHADNLRVNEAENQCDIRLDLAIALTQAQRGKAVEDTDLKEANFTVFSRELLMAQQLTTLLTKANGKVEHIETIEHLVKALTRKHLNRTPVAAVIVTAEDAHQHYEAITNHLNTLAKPIRPQVMVLQAQYNTKLHQLGLFEHSELAIRSVDFAKQLKQFIQTQQANNLVAAAEVFKQYQFSQSQVEVLVAAEQPQQVLMLTRILHWLGLQVHLVSHQQMLLERWQSGRYLVLFNQLAVDPFVEMTVGKKVSRGVFNLAIDGKDNQPAIKKAKAFSHWHAAVIDNILDIDKLVKLLSPWLKITYREAQIVDNKQVVTVKNDDKSLQVSKTQVQSVEGGSSIEQSDVFDLARYVQNQGSLELAVFMLDDYIEDINRTIVELEQNIAAQNIEQAKRDNQQLEKTARIIAAQNIQLLTNKLTQVLASNALSDSKALIAELNVAKATLIANVQAI
ncbi:hypothetical protein tinsulaeT_14970 [Thalassotalea insulae]|uniref:Uncharacterized protein n=1 Tax=Thalassotalea insulae TaxID=2056778 RepID=A0ABQ6GRY4_9GAMM|nr:hypothetical protein [Thalassotalea insulae]GLX78157.1 hypothetical protein tinsulaeT_14970 [Thalassotalea insulae]